jgi:hypothetical protein
MIATPAAPLIPTTTSDKDDAGPNLLISSSRKTRRKTYDFLLRVQLRRKDTNVTTHAATLPLMTRGKGTVAVIAPPLGGVIMTTLDVTATSEVMNQTITITRNLGNVTPTPPTGQRTDAGTTTISVSLVLQLALASRAKSTGLLNAREADMIMIPTHLRETLAAARDPLKTWKMISSIVTRNHLKPRLGEKERKKPHLVHGMNRRTPTPG